MKNKVCILAAVLMTASPVAAEIKVGVEKARTLQLSKDAAHVAIGNAKIADVQALDSNTLMVFGKSYGVTSLTVADAEGRTFYSTDIAVTDPGNGHAVSLYLGPRQKDYACSSRCQTTDKDQE